MNRKLYQTQMYANVKQKNIQTIQNFDAHLNTLKAHLLSYIEQQRIIHFFIKLRSSFRTVLINYQNLFINKKNLISLTTKLKNNMKTRITVETQLIKSNKNFNNKFDRDKSKNNKIEKNIFKNVDATKNKNDRKSKFFRKRKHDDEKNHFELICFICHKSKHIAPNCPNKKNNNKKFKIVVVATKKKNRFSTNLIRSTKTNANWKSKKLSKWNKKFRKMFQKKWRSFY